jgi:DNA-binding beta-propeller fold protein YncE
LTVAGENEEGNGLHQLSYPYGIFVDDDQTIYVADCENHHIVK